jgi:hypothetical protein
LKRKILPPPGGVVDVVDQFHAHGSGTDRGAALLVKQ